MGGEVRTSLGWAIAGLGMAVSLAALWFFVREANGYGWYCYAASLVLVAVGLCLTGGTRDTTREDQDGDCSSPDTSHHPHWWQRVDIWLLVILALALGFRLFRFHSLPFGTWYDEAVAGLDARRVWSDPSFWPVFWESMNHPAHHLYLFALSLRLFGDTIWGLRTVSVGFGVGTVLVAYLFGRELRGRRWGLLLAFVVATMRWDVNFSRVAMNSVDVPFFAFLTLYCGLRALHGDLRHPRWVAATGLSLGLGLCFYTGFRLFAALFIVFGLVCLWLRRRSAGRSLALSVVAVWIAVMPVAQFAVLHPETFWHRTRAVSVFSNRENPDLAAALANNVLKHALMFNYRGDPNGRHNLPGAPTLDRLSAVLFALGLGLALARRNRASLFFLLLLPAGLAGGILSLDFEAPQSLRSIAALPAVVYFIALALDGLWCELSWAAYIDRPSNSRGIRLDLPRPGWSLLPVAVGLGVIAFGNAETYFVRQANDAAAWQAFSTAESLVGMRVAEMDAEAQSSNDQGTTLPIYYFSPLLYDHPSIRFHAPVSPGQEPPSERKVMPLPDPLPAREEGDRPVVYFIHPDEAWVVDLLSQIYPDAEVEQLPGDGHHPVVVTMARLQPTQVTSVQGLDARFWPGDDDAAAPSALVRWPAVDGTWPDDAPLELPFLAEWSGVLYAPQYGRYQLAVEAPGQLRLTLDGQQSEATDSLSLDVVLAQGNHGLRLWARGGMGRVRLSWQPPGSRGLQTVPRWALYSLPVSAHGLLGKYYANPDLKGTPVLERIDPALNLYFHLTPLPRPYSVEWTGSLEVPYDGLYSFGLRAVDGAELFLDGRSLLRTPAPDTTAEEYATLTAGLHDLRLTFRDTMGRSRIHLYWTRPGGENEIIPSAYLWPSAASAQAAPSPAPTEAAEAVPPPLELVWLATWGEPGDGEGQFIEPRDVATWEETVYVADTGNQRVQAFTRDGAFRTLLKGGEEDFVEPLALGTTGDGTLLVLDSLDGWIYRFAPASGVEGCVGVEPIDRVAGPDAALFHPRGMTVLPDDTIVVADTGGARLAFFNATGSLVGELGGYGTAPGEMREPTDVARDEAGTFYVLEAYNQRLQRVDRWGGSLGMWTIPPSVAHDGPHMAWAPDGSLLVTAPDEGAVMRYAPNGEPVGIWTDAGGSPMRRPVGIHVDERGIVYVADTLAHRVYLFELQR